MVLRVFWVCLGLDCFTPSFLLQSDPQTNKQTCRQDFRAVERWKDYSFPPWWDQVKRGKGVRRHEDEWMDWWIQKKQCGINSCSVWWSNQQWLVCEEEEEKEEEHPDISWWEGRWWCWQWLVTGGARTPVVLIGTTSHANQLTWRWKHSHLKWSFCRLLPGF